MPDIGRVNGRYGDNRTGRLGAAADLLDLRAAMDPALVPARVITLGLIDLGLITPDPESRLGAYAATRGHARGTVGESVHRAIGTIYLGFGTAIQEKIGRVFGSPEARALYDQPVDSPAGALMAAIEHLYWSNVRAEDPYSIGGRVGAAFDPATRDWLQREVFSSEPEQ